MKIITSIYAYNFHLIISYLNEGVQIVPFKDNRSKFYNSRAEYPLEIKELPVLNELQARKHVLYGNSNSKLTSIDLLRKTSHSTSLNERQVPLDDITQLSINYQQLNLYALSDTKGIFQIDISHPKREELRNNYVPTAFEKIGNPSVSNIEASYTHLLISIRNYGVVNLTVENEKYRERKELRSEDAQDVKRLGLHDLIVVADSEEGVIFYRFKDSRLIRKIKLPNGDFPQQIETTNAAIIIKGAMGLYAYYFTTEKLLILREGKIGALTVYYDYIFFGSRGKLFSLTINNSFDKHGFSFDRDKVNLELLRRKE